MGELISTGGKINIVEEAFTILAIQNYWPRWFSTSDVSEAAKWTDSCQGNAQYMGWHEDAYSRFDQICRHIKHQRQTVESTDLELAFQQKATTEYGTRQGGTRARSKRQEPSIVVFNELANGNQVAI